MRVHILRLFDALQRIAWKHGMVEPERLKHTMSADGTHTISLVLEAEDVEYTAPKRLQRPSWGASTPEGSDGRKR